MKISFVSEDWVNGNCALTWSLSCGIPSGTSSRFQTSKSLVDAPTWSISDVPRKARRNITRSRGCSSYDGPPPPADSHTTIKIGWDLPLLDIDSRDPPSLEGIRDTLQQLIVGGALRNHKTCPHMADGKALSEFISAAVCDCFRKPGRSKTPDIGLFEGTPCECSRHWNGCARSRKQFLTCEGCGALYTWALTSGRITLIYRYSWSVYKPTSPAWLSLLDDLPTLAGIFHEKNKHIFWCDSPGCATGRDMGLWQDMVKEEMGLHHERFEEPNMELCDWFTHLRRSRKLGYSQIRMPPRATVPELPGFLHAVREAAKSEFQDNVGP